MQLTFEQVINLVELLIIVIALILMHRSIPSAQLQGLFDALEKAAKQTPTTVDDTAVSAGKLFAQLLTGQQAQPPAPAVDAAGSTKATVTSATVTQTPTPDIHAAQTELIAG